MDWYRYIFGRLYWFQIPRNKKRVDSYVAALTYMSIPWGLWLVLLDGVVSDGRDQESMIDDIGKWPVLVVAFAVIIAINFGVLKGEYSRSEDWLKESKYSRWGTLMSVGYFALPALALVTWEFLAH